MVHARNDIYLAILAFACFGIGAIYAQTSIAAEAAELTHCIKAAEPRWIFAEPCFEDSVQSCLDNSGVDLHGFFIFDRLDAPLEYGGSKRTFSSLFGDAERDWIRFDELQRASSTVILRSFTSGSTSLPKVVQLSHRNLAFTVALRMSLEANKEYEASRLMQDPLTYGRRLTGAETLHPQRPLLSRHGMVPDGCGPGWPGRLTRLPFTGASGLLQAVRRAPHHRHVHGSPDHGQHLRTG